VRAERHREQTLLSPALDLAPDVEEGAGDRPVADDLDRARLLDDVERVGIAGRSGDVIRRVEAADDRRERVRPRGTARPAGRADENQSDQQGR
jgi:hypothetical protein